MAEPTSAAVATAAATAVAIVATPPLMVWGISTGLRPDMLLAGFAGSLVSIVLLNAVPAGGDTWQHMLRATLRRLSTAAASAALAGYLGPAVLELANIPASLALATAFTAGAGAQRALQLAVARLLGTPAAPAGPPDPPSSPPSSPPPSPSAAAPGAAP